MQSFCLTATAQVNSFKMDEPKMQSANKFDTVGNNDKYGIKFQKVVFSDDTAVNFNTDSIIILTGPNNCGKSQTLRDLVSFGVSKVTTKEFEAVFLGDQQSIINRILLHPAVRGNEDAIRSHFISNGGSIFPLLQVFAGTPQIRELFIQNIVKYVTTSNRLSAIQTSQFMPQYMVNQGGMYPIQLASLYENRDFEKKFSNIVKGAFGKNVLINRYSFQSPTLHFLDEEEIEKRSDHNTKAFADWFASSPLLDQQGDGIRSFCSVLLTVLENPRPCVLIDEPEAFLHPPQIRRLAKEIAENAESDTQFIISTHSADFLQGLLDFADKRVGVIRMTRKKSNNQEINAVKMLNSENISEFWRDPLLKTSDALTALFHDVAVIVEGDSDARFFRTIIDQISEKTSKRLPDIRFYHCGGKDRIYKIVTSLKSIGVPVVCVVDIDILDDKSKFKTLFKSLGGNVNDIEACLEFCYKFVSEKKSVMNSSDAKIEIGKVFDGVDLQKPLTKDNVNSIIEVIHSASAWRLVKSSGENFFTRGEPYNKFSEIRKSSEEIGLIINEYGELENFDKTVEARKSEWLSKVIAKNLADDADLEGARKFASKIIDCCRKAINRN